MAEAQGIVVFTFGEQPTDPSNIAIRDVSRIALRFFPAAPIFTQPELVMPDADITYVAGKTAPTLRISRGAVDAAMERGIRTLWIVGLPPHLWRCKRDLDYAVRQRNADIAVHVFTQSWSIPRSKWFGGRRWCVRSPWGWYPRETILHLMPMQLYVRIAS